MGEPVPAETVGSYRLTECRAEGHIARICRAVDRTNGQRVLIRLVDPLACRNERLRAVLEDLRDPRSARRVHDPHLLRILDVGTRGESYYVVHEDFGGAPLDEYLREGRPTLREALHLARGIAECLRAVHGYKMVHGDVKPQNILVGKDPRGNPLVKMALADLTHDASDAMVSIYGELVGSPKYLSPEQIQGRSVTSASDIFSLGVVFYELFSGREPLPSSNALGYLHSNAALDAKPLCVVDTSIPLDLSRVVERMLAREPRNRYRSVQGILDDLDRVEGNLGGVAPESVGVGADSAFAPSSPAPVSSEARWRAVAVISLSAAIVLFAATVLTLLSHRGGARQPAPGEMAAPATSPAPVPAPAGGAVPALNPELPIVEREFAALRQQSAALVQSGNADEAVRRLKALQERTKSPTLAPRVNQEIAVALLGKAEHAVAQDRLQDAVAVLRSILAEYPDTDAAASIAKRAPEMLLARARFHQNRAELEQTDAALQVLLSEYPNSAAAAEALAGLPALRLRLAQAILPTQPDKAMSLLRDLALSKTGGDEAAAAKGILSQALLSRADEHFRHNRFAESLADLREAARVDPSVKAKVAQKEPESLVRLALEYRDRGRPAEALAAWKELTERFPASVALIRHQADMASLLETAGPLSGRQTADDPAMLWAMAEKELKADRFDAARPSLEKLVKVHGATLQGVKAAQVLAERDVAGAMALAQSGKSEEAQKALETAAALYAGAPAATQAARELARFRATPKGMVYVPPGEFAIGLDISRVDQIARQFSVPSLMVTRWFGLQVPSHRVKLKGYYIDLCEVTNEQYKAFVDAMGYAPPPSPDWAGKDVKPGAQRKPVACVSWEDASAYAKWAGKRLPTEAEWEKAARGTDARLFPWGDQFEPQRCVTAVAGQAGGADVVGTIPDGRSPYGVFDMIGNVQEWTTDPLRPYPDANTEGLPFNEDLKVARGAGWDEIGPNFCLATTRFGMKPNTRSPSLGFRCVKDAE